MRRPWEKWLAPLAATWVLGSVALTTFAGVRRFDVWRGRAKGMTAQLDADPYAQLERSLGASPALDASRLRSPFAYGGAPSTTGGPKPTVSRPPKPTGPAPPRLTAILWSADDPRAVILWNGRSYSVRAGQGFEGFRVVTIASDHVVLDRGGRSIVLDFGKKGE